MRAGLTVLALALGASTAQSDPRGAPIEAASIAVEPGRGAAMLARLEGQRARLVAGRLVIDDVAGEGRPWVGVIERRGAELWLRTDDGALRLAGPLARPRVAGPGYRAWATGTVDAATATLRVRRLGILAPPTTRDIVDPTSTLTSKRRVTSTSAVRCS